MRSPAIVVFPVMAPLHGEHASQEANHGRGKPVCEIPIAEVRSAEDEDRDDRSRKNEDQSERDLVNRIRSMRDEPLRCSFEHVEERLRNREGPQPGSVCHRSAGRTAFTAPVATVRRTHARRE
jgi:hypothetical protein